jgi:hypothetical protein
MSPRAAPSQWKAGNPTASDSLMTGEILEEAWMRLVSDVQPVLEGVRSYVGPVRSDAVVQCAVCLHTFEGGRGVYAVLSPCHASHALHERGLPPPPCGYARQFHHASPYSPPPIYYG